MIDVSSQVLILTGAPGSGKTSVAKRLANGWQRSVHLESDRFFHFIESGYIEPWRSDAHRQNQVVMGIVAGAAARYAQAGYVTVIDGIVLPRWFLGPLQDALQCEGLTVAYAVLRPSLAVAQERARTRSGSFSDPVVIDEIWNGFADLGDLESHAIDSTKQSTAETAKMVEERLNAGDLRV